MTKTILITGATDGIGLRTAEILSAEGHTVLLHGRNAAKLEAAAKQVGGTTEQYIADLSNITDVHRLVSSLREKHRKIDVIINNAGILKSPDTVTTDGYDIRFVVNTIAPYMLTRDLLPIIQKDGRVVNLSSAAQAPVDLDALHGRRSLGDMEAYAQSKLALTIWSREMAKSLPEGPAIIAVNPGSLLASKMVKQGFGVAGSDLGIGANILREAALGPLFAKASGRYFDNDSQQFAEPHMAALDETHSAEVMQGLNEAVAKLG